MAPTTLIENDDDEDVYALSVLFCGLVSHQEL